MIHARGNSSICKEMALTHTELITIKDLANNLSQKECVLVTRHRIENFVM